MYLKKQSVVCLVVATICSLLLAAYMAAPSSDDPYGSPQVAYSAPAPIYLNGGLVAPGK